MCLRFAGENFHSHILTHKIRKNFQPKILGYTVFMIQKHILIKPWILHHIDIDECADGTHRCSQICRNNIGSYSCLCSDGFQLDSDGFHCEGTIHSDNSYDYTQQFNVILCSVQISMSAQRNYMAVLKNAIILLAIILAHVTQDSSWMLTTQHVI